MKNKFAFKDKLITEIGQLHHGGNFVLDKGLPYDLYAGYIKSFSKYIKMIKLGWTSWSLLSDEDLQKKIDLAKEYNIPLCLGGSLFEISYNRGLYDELLEFVTENNFHSIELGSGFAVNAEELPDAIKKAKAKNLSVMVEIGFKNQELDDSLSIEDRMSHITSAVEAGADYIILEAREQGEGYSVFKKDVKENEKLLKEILDYLPIDKVIFEAPNRNSQVPLILKVGSDVNLGNIPFDELMRVETFRRRLHADTFIKK